MLFVSVQNKRNNRFLPQWNLLHGDRVLEPGRQGSGSLRWRVNIKVLSYLTGCRFTTSLTTFVSALECVVSSCSAQLDRTSIGTALTSRTPAFRRPPLQRPHSRIQFQNAAAVTYRTILLSLCVGSCKSLLDPFDSSMIHEIHIQMFE